MDIKERHRRNSKRTRIRNKALVLEAYGMECVLCGFDDPRALQIDHVNNDGAEMRQEKGRSFSGTPFYSFLVKEKFPEGYQTLCANCNTIKEYERRQV